MKYPLIEALKVSATEPPSWFSVIPTKPKTTASSRATRFTPYGVRTIQQPSRSIGIALRRCSSLNPSHGINRPWRRWSRCVYNKARCGTCLCDDIGAIRPPGLKGHRESYREVGTVQKRRLAKTSSKPSNSRFGSNHYNFDYTRKQRVT